MHNQYRHRAPGSVKFRTGGHSPRTALAGRQNRTNLRIRAGRQDSARDAARKRGRTGENPVPTVQSGWKVARAEKGRSALCRAARETLGQLASRTQRSCFREHQLFVRQGRGIFRRCRYVIPLDRSRLVSAAVFSYGWLNRRSRLTTDTGHPHKSGTP